MKAYIYTYWSETKNSRVSKDLLNSNIFSIATLRKYTKDKILVIDYSDSNW